MRCDIRHWMTCRFAVDFTLERVCRMTRRLDFRHVSPRPVHPQAKPEDQESFRQNFRALAIAALPDGLSSEDVPVFFQDEARIGQKGVLSPVWKRKGQRPRIPQDDRCWLRLSVLGSLPRDRKRARSCLRQGQHRRIEASSARRQQRAGREHTCPDSPRRDRLAAPKDLDIPANASLLRLPPCSPELNPVETLLSVLEH